MNILKALVSDSVRNALDGTVSTIVAVLVLAGVLHWSTDLTAGVIAAINATFVFLQVAIGAVSQNNPTVKALRRGIRVGTTARQYAATLAVTPAAALLQERYGNERHFAPGITAGEYVEVSS